MKKMLLVLVVVFLLVANQSYAGIWEESYGASTGMALYNSQMILGMASDAKVKKVYTDNEIKDIVSGQKNGLKTINNIANKLFISKNISNDDRAVIAEIFVCIEKLNATADSLLNYVSNPTNKAAVDFDKKYKESDTAIDKLLGIK